MGCVGSVVPDDGTVDAGESSADAAADSAVSDSSSADQATAPTDSVDALVTDAGVADVPATEGLPSDVRPADVPGSDVPSTCAVPCAPADRCVSGACVRSPSCPNPTERGCGAVLVPGGTFAMGETGIAAPVQPNIAVRTFVIDAYEVTVARFRRFSAGGMPAPASIAYPLGSVAFTGRVDVPQTTRSLTPCNWSTAAATRESLPLNCVTWWTAQAFCAWDGARLPTEAEWEFAARGRVVAGLTTPRSYPWGNNPPSTSCDLAEWNFCAGESGGSMRAVGRFAGSGGIFDLAGNVREWTADTYIGYADARCWGGGARTDPFCTVGTNRAYRGGSWCSPVEAQLHSSWRSGLSATSGNDFIGFRCARNP